MKLLHTYKVKLAYGRNLYGHRVDVEMDNGQVVNMTRSEYKAMLVKAAPAGVFMQNPAIVVGTPVLVHDMATGYQYPGLVSKVFKHKLRVKLEGYGRTGEEIATDEPVYVYPSLNLMRAQLEASENPEYLAAVDALKAACAVPGARDSWHIGRPATPAQQGWENACNKVYEVKKAIAAKWGFSSHKELDSIFGIY